MPIVFEQPGVVNPAVNQTIGTGQAMEQELPTNLKFYSEIADRNARLQQAYMQAAVQSQGHALARAQAGDQLAQQQREFTATNQLRQQELAQRNEQFYAGLQHADEAAQQHAALEAWVYGQKLTYNDAVEQQKKLNAVSAIWNDPDLTDEEKNDGILQLQTGIDRYNQRFKQAQAERQQDLAQRASQETQQRARMAAESHSAMQSILRQNIEGTEEMQDLRDDLDAGTITPQQFQQQQQAIVQREMASGRLPTVKWKGQDVPVQMVMDAHGGVEVKPLFTPNDQGMLEVRQQQLENARRRLEISSMIHGDKPIDHLAIMKQAQSYADKLAQHGLDQESKAPMSPEQYNDLVNEQYQRMLKEITDQRAAHKADTMRGAGFPTGPTQPQPSQQPAQMPQQQPNQPMGAQFREFAKPPQERDLPPLKVPEGQSVLDSPAYYSNQPPDRRAVLDNLSGLRTQFERSNNKIAQGQVEEATKLYLKFGNDLNMDPASRRRWSDLLKALATQR